MILLRAIRLRPLGKYLGLLGMGVGLALLVPAAAAIWLKDWGLLIPFVLPAVAAGSLGAWGWWRVPEQDLQRGEVLAVAALAFPVAAGIGAIPYALSQTLPWLDAFFEAMSGFTTTGFTLLDVEEVAHSILLWRALTQWLGGLGFIVLILGILIPSGSTAARMAVSMEAAEPKIFPTVKRHARAVAGVYAIITVLGGVLYSVAGMSGFEAVTQALCTVSTGGFAVRGDSMASYAGPALWAGGTIMFLGAVNFSIYSRAAQAVRGFSARVARVSVDPQVLGLVGFSLVVTGLLWWDVRQHPAAEGLGLAAFHAVSAQSTTGFSTAPLEVFSPFGLAVLIAAMGVGGGLGSTAGGIKLFRVLLLGQALHRYLRRPFLPEELVQPFRFMGESVSDGELRAVSLTILAYLAAVFLGTLVVTAAGYPFLHALFETTSAFGTVGLSTGIIGPSLSPGLKALFTVEMWMGRVEVLPVLMLLYPGFWPKGG